MKRTTTTKTKAIPAKTIAPAKPAKSVKPAPPTKAEPTPAPALMSDAQMRKLQSDLKTTRDKVSTERVDLDTHPEGRKLAVKLGMETRGHMSSSKSNIKESDVADLKNRRTARVLPMPAPPAQPTPPVPIDPLQKVLEVADKLRGEQFSLPGIDEPVSLVHCAHVACRGESPVAVARVQLADGTTLPVCKPCADFLTGTGELGKLLGLSQDYRAVGLEDSRAFAAKVARALELKSVIEAAECELHGPKVKGGNGKRTEDRLLSDIETELLIVDHESLAVNGCVVRRVAPAMVPKFSMADFTLTLAQLGVDAQLIADARDIATTEGERAGYLLISPPRKRRTGTTGLEPEPDEDNTIDAPSESEVA